MDRKQLLEIGLTEEHADAVIKALDGAYVPKTRFNELNEQHKAAKKDLETRDTSITELTKERDAFKAAASKLTDTEKEMQTLRDQLTAKDADILAVRKSGAERLAIHAAKARNVKAVSALLNTKDLEYDPEADSIKGLAEMLTELKEREAYLFEPDAAPAEPAKPPVFTGMKPAEGADGGMEADDFIRGFNKGFE